MRAALLPLHLLPLHLLSLPLLSLPLLLAAPPALAQNELTNGEFDVDVSGWGTTDPASFVWDMLDVDLDPSSGSLKLTTTPPPMTMAFHGAVSECVAVSAGEEIYVAAWAYIPSGQGDPVQAEVGLQRFTAPGCHPLDLFSVEDGPITSYLDQWVELAFPTIVPPGIESAQVYVQARTTAGGTQSPATVHFDAAFLPEPRGSTPLLAGAATLALLCSRRRANARR